MFANEINNKMKKYILEILLLIISVFMISANIAKIVILGFTPDRFTIICAYIGIVFLVSTIISYKK
jgi:uncharacterized Tic20 family protein